MIQVAVYGTLRADECRNMVMGEKLKWTGRIGGWQMFHLGGFPAIDEINATMEDTIEVEVYEVDEDTFARCDGIEGYPNFYNRKLIETPVGDAWIYYIAGVGESKPRIDSGDWKQQ